MSSAGIRKRQGVREIGPSWASMRSKPAAHFQGEGGRPSVERRAGAFKVLERSH